MTGPPCGNDRSRGGMRMMIPSAGGHVLPLPSSASRGIGGCHLPPLGEGRGGCAFAERGSLSLVLLPGAPGSARPTRQCCGFARRGSGGKNPLRNVVDDVPYKTSLGTGKANQDKCLQNVDLSPVLPMRRLLKHPGPCPPKFPAAGQGCGSRSPAAPGCSGAFPPGYTSR